MRNSQPASNRHDDTKNERDPHEGLFHLLHTPTLPYVGSLWLGVGTSFTGGKLRGFQPSIAGRCWHNQIMSDVASSDMGPWLSPEDLAFVRRKVPMLYIDAVPIRLNDDGSLSSLGLLLTASPEGLTRSLVSGRVLYHETVREALRRHLEKDLGEMVLPQLPPTLVPFTVTEYFPTPGAGGHDPRQHAVSLCYIIPVLGDCNVSSDSLEVNWFTPGELRTPELQSEILPRHLLVVRRALATLGEA